MEENQTEDILRTIENWIATSADHNPNELDGKVTDPFLPLINSISGAFTQYHENAKSYQDQIEQLETEKKELQDENEQLQEQTENNRKSIQDLQEQLDSVKKMVQSKRVAFSSENFNLKEKSDNTQDNEDQAQEEQNQAKTGSKSPQQAKITYMDQESDHMKKLEQANRQLSLKLNSLKEQNEALKRTHQQYASEKETQLQQLQMDAAEREADLKARVQALEIENQSMKREGDSRDAKISKKDQRIDTLKSIIEKKDSELGALHLQVSELQDQVVNQDSLIEENRQIQAKLQEYDQNKQRERELYKRNTEMVQAECNDKVATYQRRINELERALTKSQLDNEELNSTIKEATENANSVIHESQVLSTKVQELQEQNSTLLQEKTQLEEKVSMLSQNSTEISMNETKHEEVAQEQNGEEEQKIETPESTNVQQQQTAEENEQTEQQQQEEVAAPVSNEEVPANEEKVEEEEKTEKSTEQPCPENASVKDPRVDALEETVLELAKKVDNLSAMMSPVSQKNQQQKSGSLVDSAAAEEQGANAESVPARFVIEQFSELVNGNKEETSSNATDILKKTKRRVTHLQKKYSDAREVIKTVQSLVQETNPIICHASLSRIFGLE